MNTALLLEMIAEGLGEQIAVGDSATGLSYQELKQRAAAAAGIMARSQAANIAFIGLNSEAFPLALYASAMAGKPFAPLNYRLKDDKLDAILARLAPALAIVDDQMLERWPQGREGIEFVARSEFLGSAATAPAGATVSPDPEDVAILLYTSGTTSEPKAALLRHRHLVSYVISTVEFMGAAPDEAALVSVPPYHVAAVSAVLTSTYSGRRIVYLEGFTPEAWVDTGRDQRITHAMMVPTMLGRVLDVIEQRGESLPHLRHLSYGGGRMPVETIERALELLPQVDLVNAYGLTETSSTIAVLTPEDHRMAAASQDPLVRRRLGSTGRPLPNLELEIRDEEGRPVPTGTEGEIWVRGEQVSGEYVGGKAVREDGWFPTRDCGFLDEAGYLFVKGRLDDVIVRGGENLSPGEIEDVIRTFPGISDVAVLGLPDTEWGERVVAAVVAQGPPDPAALKQWVRERLRSTKTPEQVFYVDELPYSETGKLLRRQIRSELEHAELAGTEST